MKKAYLKCKISKGMLSQEYAVETKLYDGTEISGFFPKHLFKENNLEVKVCNKERDKALIMPPICSDGFIENSRTWILVNTNQLI